MRTRSTKTDLALTIALVVVAGIFTAGCGHNRPSVDDSRLDIRLTGADSPEDIESKIRASLVRKYSTADVADSYRTYQITNGPTRLVFVKAYNAPRGLNMFNLYCYEQERPDNWLLRAYVPVNAYYYTNSLDHELSFQVDNEYVKVFFRGLVVFTINVQKNLNR
jgi:hypothetical protein